MERHTQSPGYAQFPANELGNRITASERVLLARIASGGLSQSERTVLIRQALAERR